MRQRHPRARGRSTALGAIRAFAVLGTMLALGCNSVFGIHEGTPRPTCVDPTGFLIDDMEDGDASICSLGGRNGFWYDFGDGTRGAELSPSPDLFAPTRIPEGPRGTSLYAARFSGSGFAKWGAKMGLNLTTKGGTAVQPTDVSGGAGGIVFWMKSNVPISVELPTLETAQVRDGGNCVDSATETNCDNHFFFQVTAPAPGWRRYEVPFNALAQRPGGGATWNPHNLLNIQFGVPAGAAFEVWVDDISFYSCAGPECQPTCSDPAFSTSCRANDGPRSSCQPPGTNCAAVSTWCADPLLIDDMEDGDSAICPSGGRRGSWYVIDDGTSSTLTPPESTFVQTPIPGGRGTSLRAARLTASGFTTWGAGMGFDLNEGGNHLYDASGFEGISFWMKSTSPVSVGVAVPETTPPSEWGGACVDDATDRNCDVHFEFNVSPAPEWALIKVPFSAFRQRTPFHGRGNLFPGSASWDSSRLIAVDFGSHLSEFDIWVDDLRFYSSCETGGCVPTCSADAPVACPASGGRPADCWPAGTDCASPPERVINAAVWGSGPADVWVVGFSVTTLAGSLRHWNGATWSATTAVATPAMFGAWGSGPTDVWALGDNGTILRWNGSAWMAVPSATTSTFNEVWGSGPSDVWAIEFPGSMRHFDGSVWSTVSGVANFLGGVWGSGPDDVWAVGDSGTVGAAGIILHWDGSVWSTMAGGALPLSGVWGSGPNDIWAVGAAGAVVHWDGAVWLPIPGGTALSLNRVWGSGPDDVWAVGDHGTIVHWDGVAWTAVPSGSSVRLDAVWGSGISDVWAAGWASTLLHWDGKTWSPSPP